MVQWYYGDGVQQFGPLSDPEIRQAISDGKLNPLTMVWRDGMTGWVPLMQVPELNGSGMVMPATMVPGVAANTNSGLAIASMVCGIVSFLFCYFAGAPGLAAVICGHLAMKQIAEAPYPTGGRGMAITGLILGYLGIVISIGSIAIFGFFISRASSMAHP